MTAPIVVCLLGSIQLSKSISPLFTFHLDYTLEGFFNNIWQKYVIVDQEFNYCLENKYEKRVIIMLLFSLIWNYQP